MFNKPLFYYLVLMKIPMTIFVALKTVEGYLPIFLSLERQQAEQVLIRFLLSFFSESFFVYFIHFRKIF